MNFTKRCKFHKTLHNITILQHFCKTLNKFTTLCTTLQHNTQLYKLYTTSQNSAHCTKTEQTLQNFKISRRYTTLQTKYPQLKKHVHTCTQYTPIHNYTKLRKTQKIQNNTQLHKSIHNFTQLYQTLQNLTKPHTIVTTLRHSTTLYTTHNSTRLYKILTQFYKHHTTIQHMQDFFTISLQHNTSQHSTQLCNITQLYTTPQNSTAFFKKKKKNVYNTLQLYTIVHKSSKLCTRRQHFTTLQQHKNLQQIYMFNIIQNVHNFHKVLQTLFFFKNRF